MNYDIRTKEGMANSVAWTERLFSMLRDGAVWHVPRSSTVVCICPSKKEATIHKGFTPDDSIAQVIKAMGWTVKEHGHEDA
jgi:hypothetical protein